ncbi:MAG: 5'-deoxynucleotidase [Clostridia bacterium]|nr:5'-deoxynucleotidase [Clostridia bacterium]MCR5693699.1 5'-deoxynucleotidase [Clostridia bacterium]
MADFFAFINRMKYINRWGLMRNTVPDDLQEHCFQTAAVAHALALIDAKLFGGELVPEKAAVYALYHDAPETITGDMPTPVKYHNEKLRDSYKELENAARERLAGMVPEELRDDYRAIINFEEEDSAYAPIVKAADKITAYIKCVEEENSGNADFKSARESILKTITGMELPCVDYFMKHFADSFGKTLDEMR